MTRRNVESSRMAEGGRLLEQYRALARYDAWMNERLHALAATVTDADRRRVCQGQWTPSEGLC